MSVKFRLDLRGSLTEAIKARMAQRTSDISQQALRALRTSVERSSLSPRGKARYIAAIQPYPHGVGVRLVDKIAILLEEGWKRFDMKPGLLKEGDARCIAIHSDGGTVYRTVSRNSPPTSWWHPGFKGVHLLDDLRAKMSEIVRKATEQ